MTIVKLDGIEMEFLDRELALGVVPGIAEEDATDVPKKRGDLAQMEAPGGEPMIYDGLMPAGRPEGRPT